MLQRREEKNTMTSTCHSQGNCDPSRLSRGRAPNNPRRVQGQGPNKKLTLQEDFGRKSIMVGGDYQAVVPEGLSHYGESLPYEDQDQLVWDPRYMKPAEVEEYLARAQTPLNNNNKGVHAIPQGAHTRDDEQALYTLLECGFDVEEALRRCRLNSSPIAIMTPWSEEECKHFERGFRIHGKDFNSIQMHEVGTRSVAELVQFYYLWKKTERHDIFANKDRLLKKKYMIVGGFNDYMDRFLDEHEGIRCERPGSSDNSSD